MSMEKKTPFMITQVRPEDAAALLDYLKCVGGETDNLSFGPEGVPLDVEAETQYLAAQVVQRTMCSILPGRTVKSSEMPA